MLRNTIAAAVSTAEAELRAGRWQAARQHVLPFQDDHEFGIRVHSIIANAAMQMGDYAEAVNQLENPGLYKLSTWDWGYKSITDDSRKGMMVVYYVFTFEPLSIVNACIDMPRVIEIQGHILEKIKGVNYQKGQQRM